MFGRLFGKKTKTVSPEEALVREHFDRVYGMPIARLSRREVDGICAVSVEYQPAMPSRPLPYKVFRVIADQCDEVDIKRHPEFALHGRK
jgi:hypothetical protein